MHRVLAILSFFYPTRRGVVAVLCGLLVTGLLWWQWPLRPRMTLKPEGRFIRLLFSPDSQTLATLSVVLHDHRHRNCQLQLWDLGTGEARKAPDEDVPNQWHLCFSPDGRKAAAYLSQGRVIAWDVATGNILEEYPAKADSVVLTYTVDGKLAVAPLEPDALEKKKLVFRSVPENRELFSVPISKGENEQDPAQFQDMTPRSPYLSHIALSDIASDSIEFYHLSTGKLCMKVPATDFFWTACVSSDGKTALVVDALEDPMRPNVFAGIVLTTWDGENWGKRVEAPDFDGFPAVSDDGTFAVVTGEFSVAFPRPDNWWTQFMRWLGVLEGNDPTNYASVVFDLKKGTEVATIPHAYAAGFSPDGKTLAVAVRDNTVQLWDLPFPTKPLWAILGAGFGAGVLAWKASTWFGCGRMRAGSHDGRSTEPVPQLPAGG